MSNITRKASNATVALTTSSTTTPDIAIEKASAGQIHIPTGSSITTLTYYTLTRTGDTPLPAQDAAASPAAVVQTVAATKSYPIPAVLFGAPIIRIVANAAGNVGIALKS